MTDKRRIFVSCPRDENYIEIVQFFRKQKKMLSSKEWLVYLIFQPYLRQLKHTVGGLKGRKEEKMERKSGSRA